MDSQFSVPVDESTLDPEAVGRREVLSALLQVLDSCDRALAFAHHDDTLEQGVRLVERQLLAVMARFGVERLDPVGEPFDPQRHELVSQLPTMEMPPGTVAQVLSCGYLEHGRVLRPAHVIVSVGG